MLVTNKRKKDILIVNMIGELDNHSANDVRLKLDDWLQDITIKYLIFDLKSLSFMDSSGIGILMGRYKIISQRNGHVAVVNVDNQIHKVLEVSGLYKILLVFNNVDEALDSFQGVK